VVTNIVKEHYDHLLADHYEWMFGASFESKVDEQKALLSQVAGLALSNELAVDLGCGSGFQSIALNDLGYRVLAVDLSEKLIATLASRIGTRDITANLGDLMQIRNFVAPASAALVVCMGDTLTHLPSTIEVSKLFKRVNQVLVPGGRFVVTWRDLAASEPVGLDRFILVRSDEERIMTCCLEYSRDTVMVNDLIYVRDTAGTCTLNKSAYQKLRLSMAWVHNAMSEAGLTVKVAREGRLALLSALKGPQIPPV
jgi:SAM-dependent methyltransferase